MTSCGWRSALPKASARISPPLRRAARPLRASKPRWRLPRPAAVEALAEAARLQAEPALTDSQRALALRSFFRAQRAREQTVLQAAGVPPAEAAEQARRSFDGLSRYRHFDAQGPFRYDVLSWPGGGGPRYDVLHPGSRLPVRVPSRGWAWTQETMQERLRLGAAALSRRAASRSGAFIGNACPLRRGGRFWLTTQVARPVG